MPNDSPITKSLSFCSVLMQKRMDELLSVSEYSKNNPSFKSSIIEAMRYSAISEGKMIRPFLLLTTAEIFGISYENCLNCASAIEFIHVYSLIHDDLPAMDDDDFRRGKLSNHKKFDEATAILAGDALLTYAFEILASKQTCNSATIRCELIKIISNCAGFNGMVGGQMLDIENADKKLSYEQIIQLHNLKTAKMFVASAECGAVIGKAKNKEKIAIVNYAKNLGLVFQIKDDIDDYQKSKTDNSNIVKILGIQKAKEQLHLLEKTAKDSLKLFDSRGKLLTDLLEMILEN